MRIFLSAFKMFKKNIFKKNKNMKDAFFVSV